MHQDCEDNSYSSQHLAISAVLNILAAILDSGDRIAKPTNKNGFAALDYP